MRYPRYQWGGFAVGVLLIALYVVLFVFPALIGLMLLLGGGIGE